MSAADPPGHCFRTRFRFLDTVFEVQSESEIVHDHLHAEMARPQYLHEPTKTVGVAIRLVAQGVVLSVDGESPVLTSEQEGAQRLGDLAAEIASRDFPSAMLVRAAMVEHDNGALLLVGRRGVGRTTLALALAVLGWRVVCDHFVLLEPGGMAHPYPGRFKTWMRSVKILHSLDRERVGPILQRAPDGIGALNLDPTDLGLEWRVPSLPVSAIVLLEANFGGQPRMRPLEGAEFARMLLVNASPPRSSHRGWLVQVMALCSRIPTAVLEIGDLRRTEELLRLCLPAIRRER